MRVFLLAAATLVAQGCVANEPAPVEVSGNDCAVVAAVAKEHYKFGADNPALPLKASADGWKPSCDWAEYELSFTDYAPKPGDDPRESLRYVDFQKPVYDGGGATIATSIMHGPLAGTGQICTLRSGIAGWTVTGCKMAWIS